MLELWNTVISGCTFAVLSITAVLALIQLHHLRSSYQLTAASTLLQAYWSPIFQESSKGPMKAGDWASSS